MKKIVVTGGSGKAGRATVRELLEHGYEVLNIDIAPPRVIVCRIESPSPLATSRSSSCR